MNTTARIRAQAPLMALILAAGCSATQSSQPSASSSGSPSAAGSPGIADCTGNGPSAAGTYRLPADQTLTGAVPITATIDIADGWRGCGLLSKDWGEVGGPSIIGFWEVENVYANPCQWDGGQMDPAVGPTASDLTMAMVDQELTEAAPATADALGGYPASYMRLSVPEDLDVTNCDAVDVNHPEFRFWKGPGEERTGSAVWWLGAADAPGLTGEVWAADVAGTRVVVQAAYLPGAAQAEIDEIHGIVDSIVLEP